MGRFCLNCGHRVGAPVAPPDPPEPPQPSVSVVDVASDDLLPFAEGAPTTKNLLGGRAIVAWVLGAALLVALVVVLLRVLAVDGADTDETATDPTSGQEPESAEPSDPSTPPERTGRATDVARTATYAVPSTAPPTTDFDGQLASYVAAHLHDGQPSTTWRMAGDGTGKAITINLRRPTVVTRVGLVNGYAKQVSGVDWYPNNRRILTARWGFDDGTTLEQSFAERPDLQQLKVPAVLTSTVTLTITSVTPPGAGDLGRDYTAISEIAITGRRAR